jgi:hypothetical protein
MSNAAIFISFPSNPLKCRIKHATLNQRVQGSSPCAPTKSNGTSKNYWRIVRLAQPPGFCVRPRSVNLTASRFPARNPPLPAALVCRGIGRLLCRARSQRATTRLCLFRGGARPTSGNQSYSHPIRRARCTGYSKEAKIAKAVSIAAGPY